MKTLLAIILLSSTTMSFGDTINVPPIPPTDIQTVCTTDLIDAYGSIVRTFTGNGYNHGAACKQSEDFCYYVLQRHDTNGYRCVTRGASYPPPRPPQEKIEQCTASRFDPGGTYIQSYTAQATGPWEANVKDQACRQAYMQCYNDLRGRQTCRIDG